MSCGSVAQSVVECSHGKRETLDSSPGQATFYFRSFDIWWLSVDPCSGCEQQKKGFGSLWFRHGSEQIRG